MNIVEAVLELPFYTTGALLGLLLGYIYATLQVMQRVPGLKWLASMIGTQLPQTLSRAPLHDDKADVAARPSSFAVMDTAALGNALYAMETPTAADAAKPFLEPTAAVANGQQQHGFVTIPNQDYIIPMISQQNNITNNITDNTTDTEDQQVLDSVRDRLASFPLDNMSPTTTVGTALSLATAVLAPSGLAADADDEVIMAVDRIPEHPEMDIGFGPNDPIEGELDITYASSSNNIVRTSSAAAAGDQGVRSLLPAAAARSDSVKSNGLGIHSLASPHTKKFTPGGAIRDLDVVPLTDRAVQQLNQHHADSAIRSEISNPSAGLLTDQGSPKRTYVLGLPAQRQAVTFQSSRSGGSSGDTAAAAAAGSFEMAPATPRSERSMVSVSSVKTADSDATAERKKKKGLFASLRQKAGKGRQQVR